jgi:hypothetical protein
MSVEESASVEHSTLENPTSQKKKPQSRERFPSVTWRIETQPWSMLLRGQAASVQALQPLALSSSPLHVEARSHTLRASTAPQLLFVKLSREIHMAAPDFEPFLTSQPFSLSPSALAESFPIDGVVFYSNWSWERVCQEIGCIQAGAEVSTDAAQTQEQFATQGVMTSDASRDSDLPVTESHYEGPNYIEGIVMHEIWLAVVGAGVLLSFLTGIGVMLVWSRRQAGARTEKSDGWEARMAYLEEAVNRAGVLNSSFFHSLEIAQKRLEALLTQADLTEQNLRRFIHQAVSAGDPSTGRGHSSSASVERTDSFATAALLLSEGEDVQQVARALKLPLAQVRLLQEIRQLAQPEKQEKTADPREKTAAPQKTSEAVSLLEDVVVRLNGTERNGIRFAQNGQSL